MCQSPMKQEQDKHKNSDAQRQRSVHTVTVDSDTHKQSENTISNVLHVHGSKYNCIMNVDASTIIVHPTVNNVVLALEVNTMNVYDSCACVPVTIYKMSAPA